jgi:outer membrane lipoprotein-sorting protein
MAFRLCTLLAVFPLLLGSPASAELETADAIDACYRSNFPKVSSVQTVSMNSKDRIGAVTTSKAKLYWKKFDEDRSKVMMKFFKPAEMRGAGLLMVQKSERNDMMIYLPELGRVKRVTKHMSSSSMFGTDFSYEEFERIQGIANDAPATRLDDSPASDRPAYVLEIRPLEGDSAYERIKSWVDKETCVALRAEFYERGDKPRKVMTADASRLTREGEIWMSREMLMKDLRDETETVMLVEEVDVGADIPRKMFSERELTQSGH